jgi:hypothetical protein
VGQQMNAATPVPIVDATRVMNDGALRACMIFFSLNREKG